MVFFRCVGYLATRVLCPSVIRFVNYRVGFVVDILTGDSFTSDNIPVFGILHMACPVLLHGRSLYFV